MGEKREWQRRAMPAMRVAFALLLVLAVWASPALAGKGALRHRGDTEVPDACFGSVCVAKATPMSDMGMDWGDAARSTRTKESGAGHSGGRAVPLGK